MVVSRWRRRKKNVLVALQDLLKCALRVLSLLALLSVHLRFEGSRKLPSNEVTFQVSGIEHSWKREIVQPQSSSSFLSQDRCLKIKLDWLNQSSEYSKLWMSPSNRDYVPCIKPSPDYSSACSAPGQSSGYLIVHANGGLDQMRTGIHDMVAVARVINATLVVPELDRRSIWQNTSNFSDFFDEENFINALANDVKIIRKLPKQLATTTKAVKHFRSWSGMDYYQEEIRSQWEEYKVIQAAKSDFRLANNNLPPDIQKLRCRVCYEALRFAPQIEASGKELVSRMKAFGSYIALHLRNENDMLGFSGCTHDLSVAEADELRIIRENTSHWKVQEIDSMEQKAKGYCPLTPKEVGVFLKALGYPCNTPMYIPSGEIYGAETRVADLRSRFPFLASKMAALVDYIVSVESDAFIPSYSGNMARAVEGHRRFLGHRKTISPDRKSLVHLFYKIDRGTMKGMERFRSEKAFYVNPLPDCLPQTTTALTRLVICCVNLKLEV